MKPVLYQYAVHVSKMQATLAPHTLFNILLYCTSSFFKNAIKVPPIKRKRLGIRHESWRYKVLSGLLNQHSCLGGFTLQLWNRSDDFCPEKNSHNAVKLFEERLVAVTPTVIDVDDIYTRREWSADIDRLLISSTTHRFPINVFRFCSLSMVLCGQWILLYGPPSKDLWENSYFTSKFTSTEFLLFQICSRWHLFLRKANFVSVSI